MKKKLTEITREEAKILVEKDKAKYEGFINDPEYMLLLNNQYFVRGIDTYHLLTGKKKE